MSRQNINLGTIDDDGTGTDLKTGGDMINDNFIELYARGGVCNGSKWSEFQSGIRDCWMTPVLYNALYYIGQIQAGIAYSGNQLTYSVQIFKATTPSGAGIQVGVGTVHVANTSPKTGLDIFNFAKIGGGVLGAVDGFVVIDWSKFTLGSTYTCSNWAEGALAVRNTQSDSTNPAGGGGGGGIGIEILPTSATVNGSTPFLMLDPDDEAMVITLDEIANFQGPQKLKNIADHSVTIESDEDLLIDGYALIVLTKNMCVTICPYIPEAPGTSCFIVTNGNYEIPT